MTKQERQERKEMQSQLFRKQSRAIAQYRYMQFCIKAKEVPKQDIVEALYHCLDLKALDAFRYLFEDAIKKLK